MRTKTLFLWVCGMFCCYTLMAQYNVLTSPVISNDGSVTFYLHAPQAKQVEVEGQFMAGSLPLTKNEEGIWSVTVKPDKADIYPYNFVVDGVAVSDPGNALSFPNESFKSSLLEMPDPEALYTVRSVPHGKVHYGTYRSNVLNQYRNVLVYTPAEYESRPDKHYPVLYLISGTTDTEETWYKAGRAHTILDNLIARKQAEPMLIVMPYGYMNNGTPRPSSPEAADMYGVFARELTECVIPYVEANYRTIADRDHRAISGFSRGGGQSMFTALKHIDQFAWLGSYSAYLTPEVMNKHFPDLKKDTDRLKMLWFCVGTDDFLYKDVVRNMEYFDEAGIRYQADIRPGAHTWMHARYCLAETAKKVFKNIQRLDEYPDMTIDNSSLSGFTIYRPNELKEAAAKAGGRLPVLVFGNGACAHTSVDYIPLFAELVANGYLVMAVGEKEERTSVEKDFTSIGKDDRLLDAVDWICQQNITPWSDYYHLVDPFHIAVGGHSCGGAQALAASYDTRIATTLLFNAGMGDMEMAGANAKNLETLHQPILYLIGGEEDIAYSNAAMDFERIDQVPVALVNFPVGHGGTYKQPRGGVLGQVALMWLDWHLKGKSEASKFFMNAAWRKKNYVECVFQSKGLRK